MWGSRPSHLMVILNTKRHPIDTKTDQLLPISEVITGLPRPYHNINTLSRVQAHVPVYPLLTSLAVFVQAHVPVYPSHTLAVCVQAPSPGDLDNH